MNRLLPILGAALALFLSLSSCKGRENKPVFDLQIVEVKDSVIHHTANGESVARISFRYKLFTASGENAEKAGRINRQILDGIFSGYKMPVTYPVRPDNPLGAAEEYLGELARQMLIRFYSKSKDDGPSLETTSFVGRPLAVKNEMISFMARYSHSADGLQSPVRDYGLVIDASQAKRLGANDVFVDGYKEPICEMLGIDLDIFDYMEDNFLFDNEGFCWILNYITSDPEQHTLTWEQVLPYLRKDLPWGSLTTGN